MADRFYTPLPLAPGEFTLSGPEAHHMLAVRRFAIGDRVTIFNGDGGEYSAEIVGSTKKIVSLILGNREETDRELPFSIEIATTWPKGDRADFLLEKLVELGTTRLVPIIAERSVVTPKETKRQAWERAVIEASKQCGRNRLMNISTPMKLADYLRSCTATTRWILHTQPDLSTAPPIADRTVACLIGPEGGFTSGEIERALSTGWKPTSLGSRILRIETAAIAIAARLQ